MWSCSLVFFVFFPVFFIFFIFFPNHTFHLRFILKDAHNNFKISILKDRKNAKESVSVSKTEK